MMPQGIETHLREALLHHGPDAVGPSVDAALQAGAAPGAIRELLLGRVESMRSHLMSNTVSIPELLLEIDAAFAGLEHLSRVTPEEPGERKTIVIGVVRGDPHDLGKNIVARIYEIHGYRVVDLGRDVADDSFVAAVRHEDADLLALSAMMSTTSVAMKGIIGKVRRESPRTRVIVGGASLDARIATAYGADAYAETVKDVIEQTSRIFG